jgi:hypothetical protein
MKEIQLTRGKVAIVDDEDFDTVAKHKWYCKSNDYAARDARIDGQRIHVYMHRLIMNADVSEMEVDHIDGNPLNNTRANLRLVTSGQNKQNMKPRHGTYKYKGIFKGKRSTRYTATITHNYKRESLGSFKTAKEAAHAYNKAAIEKWGDAAILNDI